MKIRLIVNPVSGVRSKADVLAVLRHMLSEGGHEVETVNTRGPGDGMLLARVAADEGVDCVVAIGGDGTVREVASGLVYSDTVLGIIPTGSGNGLARHLCIPQTVREAAEVILAGQWLRCDCGRCNDDYFFCTSGTGFDADVSFRFSESTGRRGLRSYLRSVAQCALQYRPLRYRVTADDRSFEANAMVIALCNGTQYGNNAFIAPNASVTDGHLDLTMIMEGNPFVLMRGVLQLFAGTLRNQDRSVVTLPVKHLTIDADEEMTVHIDGDPLGRMKHIEYECIPGAVKIFSPGEINIKPIITPVQEVMKDVVKDLRKGI